MVIDELTPRQQQIYELNATCIARADMASALCVTPSTLRAHLIDIANKLAMPEKMNIQYFLMHRYAMEKLRKANEELAKVTAELEKLRKEKEELECTLSE